MARKPEDGQTGSMSVDKHDHDNNPICYGKYDCSSPGKVLCLHKTYGFWYPLCELHHRAYTQEGMLA